MLLNYTAMYGEGITACEVGAILDAGCEKQFAVFAIISRNGPLTQQPRTGHRRLH